jgi:ABC-type bacteriocin/lantibiotic exporter with double-glycine peptidase domain
MLIIAESLVILGLVSLLVYFEPVGSLKVFFLFLGIGSLYQWLTKKRIIHWGKLRQEHEALRMKHAQQGIGAIKDVKVSGTESFFINEYERNSDMSLSMHQKNSFIQNVTRLWLEVLAISGLTLLCLGMYFEGQTVSEILPVLGLFAAVSFRLMPSISRIVSSLNLLRFGSSIINTVEKEVEQLQCADDYEHLSALSFNKSIELKDIEFFYPTSKNPALKNININVSKGEMIGFVGKSGSGKSTVIDIIMGLLEPSKGRFLVDGVSLDRKSVRQWQRLIGYVPQFIYLTDDTLKRNIAFGLNDNEIDDNAIKSALESAQLVEFVEQLPDGLETKLGERGIRLSGGQRQRIGIARALYHDPEILVLDEATSALDEITETQIIAAINRLHGSKTILLISHRSSTLSFCDRVFSVSSGYIKG